MKKLIEIATVVMAGIIVFGISSHFRVKTYGAEAPSSIVVTGKGSIKVKPDMATLRLGVTTENVVAKAAQDENSVKMNALTETIKALGIDEKDIQTSGYSVYPRYDYNSGKNQITGYSVNSSITVIVRDIAKVGETLDKAIEAGANMSGGIQFSLSDDSSYYEKALTTAIDNAGSKSAVIAKALGVTIGKPCSVVEAGNYSNPILYRDVQYDAAVEKASIAGTGAVVQEGEIEVIASVTVTYSY